MNLADSLNLGCLCRTLSPQNLRAQLESDPSLAGLTERLATSHPRWSRTHGPAHRATHLGAGHHRKTHLETLGEGVAVALNSLDS